MEMITNFGMAEVFVDALVPAAALGRYGIGFSPGHHGEVLQGMFEDAYGEISRGLVTLPCAPPAAVATFRENREGGLTVRPSGKIKSELAAKLVAMHFGVNDLRGELTIDTEIDEALGLGSSTADVVAVARAVARSLGGELRPLDIAKIAVQAEEASDSIMYLDSTVLFAQREGRVIEVLGPIIPIMGVMSFTSGPPVKTTAYEPPSYSWYEIQQFRPLLGQLRYGLNQRSVEQIALVATKSAQINQSFLPKPDFDQLLDIVEKSGALGMQVAHSGNIVGILLDVAGCDLDMQVSEIRKRLREIGIHQSEFITTGF